MRKKPLFVCLMLSLPLGCGDDGGGSGIASTSATGGGTEGGDGDGSDADDTGPGDSGPGDSGPDSSGEDGGDPGDPAFCDFARGCYDDTMTLDHTRLGVNSWSPAGCEGEDFRATGGFQVGGGGVIQDFEAHRSMPVLADFNGDGELDVFLNPRKQTSYVVPGDGLGGFRFDEANVIVLPTPFAFSSGWGADAADIDGDGDLEPAVGDHGWDAAAWINDGSGSFTLALEGLRGSSCQSPWNGSCSVNHNGAGMADWNGDGKVDIMLGGDQFAGENIDLKLGDGSGNWSDGSAPAMHGSTGYISAADFDNDGDLDVFGFTSGGQASLTVQVFENDNGSFSSAGSYPNSGASGGGADPRQGGVGDLNCDGYVDIAAGGTIYLSDGAKGFTKAVDVDQAYISHLADMNGDGHLDLITQHPSVGLAMYYNDGTGMNWVRESDGLPDATYEQLGTTMVGAYGIDVGDLDGNGNLDIVRIAAFGTQWRLEAWTR